MAKCKACGKVVRNTRLAVVLMVGTNKGGRVCRECERGGMLVVASLVEPLVEAPTQKRADHDVLEPYVLALKGLLRATGTSIAALHENDECEIAFQKGRQAAIEAAIALLRGGRT